MILLIKCTHLISLSMVAVNSFFFVFKNAIPKTDSGIRHLKILCLSFHIHIFVSKFITQGETRAWSPLPCSNMAFKKGP